MCASAERAELLTLLLGRVLQIQEAGEPDAETAQEVRDIVQAAQPYYATADSDTQEAALDILCYLPARSEHEIVYVLDLAQQTRDDEMQQAYAHALEYAEPATDAAWAVLEDARKSNIKAIREAVERRLEAEKRT